MLRAEPLATSSSWRKSYRDCYVTFEVLQSYVNPRESRYHAWSTFVKRSLSSAVKIEVIVML